MFYIKFIKIIMSWSTLVLTGHGLNFVFLSCPPELEVGVGLDKFSAQIANCNFYQMKPRLAKDIDIPYGLVS